MANPQRTAENLLIIFLVYLSRPGFKFHAGGLEATYFQQYMGWKKRWGGCTALAMRLPPHGKFLPDKKMGVVEIVPGLPDALSTTLSQVCVACY
jgi:hypothetical protein